MDSEIKGSGNQYDYGFRIYDPRVARFLSTDPLAKEYPYYTPYQFAGNKPIIAVDILGKFRSEKSQTLLGAYNSNKVTSVVQKISLDMNTTIFGHKSYSYSSDLESGKFYGGKLSEMFNKVFDGNSYNQGKYIKISPDGSVSNVGGVGFSSDSKNAGTISETK